MAKEREAIDRALADRVVPVLREHGFTGRFPHFRRITPHKVDLLTFQFNRHGGGLVIEIAEGPVPYFTTPWGKQVPASSLTARDLHPDQRARLQPGGSGSVDAWYRYDRGMSPAAVAEQVRSDLPQVEAWFAGAKTQPKVRHFA